MQLAQSIDPDMYQFWRRYAQDSSLLYQVDPLMHHCWEHPEEIKSNMVNAQGRRLFGCLRCGRSHMCHPPEHLTCPRLTSPSNPNALVCPFSGVELGIVAVGTATGSFDHREQTLTSMREVFAATSAMSNEKRLGIRQGPRLARRLQRGANNSASATTRNSMRRQAVEAMERTVNLEKVRRFERLSKGLQQYMHLPPNWKSSIPTTIAVETDALEEQRRALVLDIESQGTAQDDMVLADTSDDMDEAAPISVLDPLWFAPPVVIPRAEIDADNEYFRQYLAPVAAFMDTPAISNIFFTSPVPAPASPPIITAPTPTKTLWRLMQPAEELLSHQRELEHYVTQFLKHYVPLLTNSPEPMECGVYVRFCDRFLWLYHAYVAPVGSANTGLFWPEAPTLPRLLFTLLTLILTQPGYARDAVTDAKRAVWFPDPWLLACSEAGLFDQAAVPRHLLAQSQKGVVNLHNIHEGLMSILKCTPFSPHQLVVFFRGAVF